MADIAHPYGATIEGELGHVGDSEGSAEGSSHMEDPSRFFFVDKSAILKELIPALGRENKYFYLLFHVCPWYCADHGYR